MSYILHFISGTPIHRIDSSYRENIIIYICHNHITIKLSKLSKIQEEIWLKNSLHLHITRSLYLPIINSNVIICSDHLSDSSSPFCRHSGGFRGKRDRQTLLSSRVRVGRLGGKERAARVEEKSEQERMLDRARKTKAQELSPQTSHSTYTHTYLHLNTFIYLQLKPYTHVLHVVRLSPNYPSIITKLL